MEKYRLEYNKKQNAFHIVHINDVKTIANTNGYFTVEENKTYEQIDGTIVHFRYLEATGGITGALAYLKLLRNK